MSLTGALSFWLIYGHIAIAKPNCCPLGNNWKLFKNAQNINLTEKKTERKLEIYLNFVGEILSVFSEGNKFI